jgi:predicted O-methyltransferase YrrM
MNEGQFSALLEEIQKYCIKNDIRAISPDCGRLLKLLVQIHYHSKSLVYVIEIGTGVGYSTLWMVKGLIDSGSKGKMYTIDPNLDRIERANFFINRASKINDLGKPLNFVKIIHGDALKVIPKFTFDVDFVFIDGSKNEYVQYLKALENRLRPGSVVTAHNVISHRERLEDFLKEINNVEKWETLIIPIDTAGLSVSIRKDFKFFKAY